MDSGGRKSRWVSKGGAGGLYIAQGFANNLFGDAGALTALGGNASGISHFTIAAATFIDGFTDLAVSNALAKTHVHMNYPLGLRMWWMLNIMRTIVKERSSDFFHARYGIERRVTSASEIVPIR